MAVPFLDTNVLVRHITADHAQFAPRATAYLLAIEQGETRVRINETVLFEAVFTLQTHYGLARRVIRDGLLPVIGLPGILLARKRRWRRAFDLYVEMKFSFADCFHVAFMEDLGLDTIVSFDRDFDKIAGIVRVEP